MKTDYESLNPRGLRGWTRRNRLYLAGDHLLLVRFDGFTEEYRRFYLRDIQGFVVRRTSRRGWYSAVLAVFVAGLGIPAVAPDVDGVVRIVFAVLASLPLVALLLNLASGSTCRTTLQTAVQRLELPVATRLGDFERLLARLTPLIESTQADLIRDTIPPAEEADTEPAREAASPPADA